MGRVLMFLAEVALALFGVTIGKDGVSFQWRRMLLWAVMLPIVGALASVILAVGGSAVDLFKSLFSDGMPVFGSTVRWVMLQFSPDSGTAAYSVWRICCVSMYCFGIDIILYGFLQLIIMRLVRDVITRIASYVHGLARMVISTVEGSK